MVVDRLVPDAGGDPLRYGLAVRDRFLGVYTAVLADILDDRGRRDQTLPPEIRPLAPGTRLARCESLQTVVPPGERMWGDTNVLVRCVRPHAWSVPVPVSDVPAVSLPASCCSSVLSAACARAWSQPSGSATRWLERRTRLIMSKGACSPSDQRSKR